MNPLDLFQFLKELLQKDPEVVAAFFMGVILAGVVGWFLRQFIFRARKDRELADLAGKNRALENELKNERSTTASLNRLLDDRERQHQSAHRQLQETALALTGACEEQKEEMLALQAAKQELRSRLSQANGNTQKANQNTQHCKSQRDSLRQQVATLSDQIQQVTDLQGKIWQKPALVALPSFRELTCDRPPIIALVNLKGGVGKTSLTANVAATLWKQGKRVLVVDLDNQASLTYLCLPPQRANDLKPGGGRYLHNVLKADAAHGTVAWQNLAPAGDNQSCILAACEELSDVEEHVKARWLLNPRGPDLRYVLRSALHDPLIQGRFDAILLDCPPRPSTACINALTCCDYALVPVLLDKTSADAVPRLLEWLRHLQQQGICRELDLLGVVANRTYKRASLTKREKTFWDQLRDKCRDAWGEPVHLFNRFIPSSPRFAEAAEYCEFAADHGDLQSFFSELVTELQQQLLARRKTSHASSRPATVH